MSLECICFDGRRIALCPQHGDAKAQRLAADPDPKGSRRIRRRRPQRERYEHELSEAFTDGIKAMAIADQLIGHGRVTCVMCGTTIVEMLDLDPGSEDYERAFNEALAYAMARTDKHHGEGRHGHGYRPKKHGNDFGDDNPLLIDVPVCRPCHTGRDSDLHRGPQFSGANR